MTRQSTQVWQRRSGSAGTRGRAARRGFTMTELLVVVGIIILVAIVTVPAFRALTGSKSTEATQNQLSAVLGRARAEAIGLQQIRGIGFFFDAETERVKAVMVKESGRPTGAPPAYDIYLDFVEDRDPVLLPAGVLVQVVDDCFVTLNSATTNQDDERDDDGYIGLNTLNVNGVDVQFGGVILFDSYGRVVSRTYAYKGYDENAAGVKVQNNFAKSFNMTGTLVGNLEPVGAPRSQFGFVVFEREPFLESANPTTGAAFNLTDPQLTTGGTYKPNELAEEKWIDENGVPILVNRNNGTLVRGG